MCIYHFLSVIELCHMTDSGLILSALSSEALVYHQVVTGALVTSYCISGSRTTVWEPLSNDNG